MWKQQNVSKHTYFTHVNAKQLQRPINHHDIKAGTLLKGLEGVSISQTTYITPLFRTGMCIVGLGGTMTLGCTKVEG